MATKSCHCQNAFSTAETTKDKDALHLKLFRFLNVQLVGLKIRRRVCTLRETIMEVHTGQSTKVVCVERGLPNV